MVVDLCLRPQEPGSEGGGGGGGGGAVRDILAQPLSLSRPICIALALSQDNDRHVVTWPKSVTFIDGYSQHLVMSKRLVMYKMVTH